MADVKIVLRQKKTKDETYPLALRITKDRKASYIYIGHNIKLTDWNAKEQRVKRSHPNSTRLNNLIIKKLADANNHLLDLETQKSELSSRAVKQRIKPRGGATFFKQAENYLETLKANGKYTQYTPNKPRIEHFRNFVRKENKSEDIAFADITITFLERFKAYLKGTLKNSERTSINNLSVIRSVFSQAIKEQITDVKYYPFGAGKIKIKFPESLKVGLSTVEVKKIEDLDLSDNPRLNHARNLWLFSFYLAGMRISDVFRLRWSDINNSRLHYSMGKNHKGGSLKLPEKALSILNQYRDQKEGKDDFIFPELKKLQDIEDLFIMQRTIAFANSRIDKILREYIAPLAKIDKTLTMHIARHTFGNISGDRISIQMLQKLYRHSSIITTIGYQGNFIHKDADEALEAVIQF